MLRIHDADRASENHPGDRKVFHGIEIILIGPAVIGSAIRPMPDCHLACILPFCLRRLGPPFAAAALSFASFLDTCFRFMEIALVAGFLLIRTCFLAYLKEEPKTP